jgi:hypothetical protein
MFEPLQEEGSMGFVVTELWKIVVAEEALSLFLTVSLECDF